MQNVEIYGTMGLACEKKEILMQMFAEGMTGMRWNLSHVTLGEAADSIEIYHEAAKACGVKPKLLIDLQGPELRIGRLSEKLILTEGEEVNLIAEEEIGRERGIPLPSFLLKSLEKQDTLLLDDGKILLLIKKAISGKAIAIVERGGVLSGRKSAALQNKELLIPTLTQEDLINLKQATAYGVTGVMQPFVRSVEDLKIVREAMNRNGCQEIALFAKIENRHGVENLNTFFPYADEIVIARGDLGNAMPLWKLPGVQKKIAAECRQAKMPFMVVTQMLASMEERAVPTRAEVSDIYNAVMDGAGSVMVTGETAVGNYPVETIRFLSRTAREAEKDRGWRQAYE